MGAFTGGNDTYKKVLSQEEYNRIENVYKSQLTESASEFIL